MVITLGMSFVDAFKIAMAVFVWLPKLAWGVDVVASARVFAWTSSNPTTSSCDLGLQFIDVDENMWLHVNACSALQMLCKNHDLKGCLIHVAYNAWHGLHSDAIPPKIIFSDRDAPDDAFMHDAMCKNIKNTLIITMITTLFHMMAYALNKLIVFASSTNTTAILSVPLLTFAQNE